MHVERRLIEMGSSPLEAGRQECESLQRLCHLQFVGPVFDEVVAAFQDPDSQTPRLTVTVWMPSVCHLPALWTWLKSAAGTKRAVGAWSRVVVCC